MKWMNLPTPGAFETPEQADGKDTDSANVITGRKAVLLQTETLPWEGKAAERVGWLGGVFLGASSSCCWKPSPECHKHTQTATSRYTNHWACSQSCFCTVKGLPQKLYYTAAQTTGGFVELQDYPPNLLKEWNRTAIEGSTEEDHKVHQLRCDYMRANQFSHKDHTICSLESSSASSEIFFSPLSLSLPLFCLLPFIQIHRKHAMLNMISTKQKQLYIKNISYMPV